MFVNVTGMGQVARRRGARTIPVPPMGRGLRGLGQSVCLATNGAGNCTCPLEDAPLGCSPSGIPWQASGGGVANNWQYYDVITGQPLNLSDACYINDDLLINCSDNQNGQQSAGSISILAQTPAYAAANAAANAAVPPPSSTTSGTTSGTSTVVTPPPISPPTPVQTSAVGPSSCFSLLSALGIPDPCFGPIGIGTLAVGAVGVIIFASMFGGKR
jgi:hypothetical protein